MVIERTIFILPITGRSLMPINTLLPLQAVAFLLEVAADRNLVFLIDVKVLALFAALALLLEPMHTDDLFYLRFVAFQAV